jgi:hypothetical protein
MPVTISVPQSPIPTTQSNPNVQTPVMSEPSASSDAIQIDQARTWWREHRQGLMGALESALTIAEKALVVVPPAQAAVGAAGAALKDIRVSCRWFP